MAESKILYGGQAVIEGVMMRGRNFVSCATRHESGQIEIKSESIPRGVYSGVWAKTPFLRALPLLWDTLVLGTRMLMWTANVQAADSMADEKKKQESAPPVESASEVALENEALAEAMTAGAAGSVEGAAMMQGALMEERTSSPQMQPVAKEPEAEGLPQGAIYGSLALSLGLGIAIFFALPVIVANFLMNFGVTAFWSNVIEAVIRLALFIGYLVAIGRIPDIQRVFMYHGAEHKTIAAYEGGAKLIPSEVQKFPKEHPRCGTGFLLTIVVVSIVFFISLGDLPLVLRLLSRILLIPVVAAVAYELIRFGAAHRNFFLFDWLIVRPSLALQSLTTRQPTDDMIEVAVAAFEDVKHKEDALVAA